MRREIVQLALVIDDYDKAIQYYCDVLDFDLVEDTQLSESKRWVVVRPKGGSTSLLLAKASSDDQLASIGNQTGGRVFLFLHIDDFWRDYKWMREKGVDFIEEPREEAFGTVVVFKDLYGNKWDMIQPK